MPLQVFPSFSQRPFSFNNAFGDTMTGELNVPSTVYSGTNWAVGAGLDDHEGRIDELETEELPTAPSYDTVTITGTAPGTPIANTIYKENQILAWGRVESDAVDLDGDGINDVSLVGNFNFSGVTRDPTLTTGSSSGRSCGDNCYELTFSTQPSGESTYVVQTSAIDAVQGRICYVVVREHRQDAIIFETESGSSDDCSDVEVDVTIVGY